MEIVIYSKKFKAFNTKAELSEKMQSLGLRLPIIRTNDPRGIIDSSLGVAELSSALVIFIEPEFFADPVIGPKVVQHLSTFTAPFYTLTDSGSVATPFPKALSSRLRGSVSLDQTPPVVIDQMASLVKQLHDKAG